MFNDDFESAFENFLNSTEYDQAEYALYSMARRGFMAGWRAAGGNVMAGQEMMKTTSKYEIPRKSPQTNSSDLIPFPKNP